MARSHMREDREPFASPWFWLRYPLFAAIAATLLEVGTLAGAPLSNPFSFGDWQPLRWLIFFIATLLVAIPLFGSLDRGFATRLRAWIVRDGGRNGWILLATTVGAVAVGWLAAWLFEVSGLYEGMPGDGRPAAIFGILCAGTAILVAHHRVLFDGVEWGFLLVVLTIGFALQVALPAFTNLSADDRAHLSAAVGISYVLDPQVTPELQAVSDAHVNTSPWYPEEPSIEEAPPQEEVFDTLFSWEASEEAKDFLGAGSDGAYEQQEGFVNALGSSYLSLNTLGRIPMASGLWVGRLFGLPLYGQLIAARVANLLFYAWIAWAAIRTLKTSKLILLLVALFPPIVMLAANLSYDPWIVSLVFLGVARFANVVQTEGEQLDARNGLRILVPLFLGVIVKAVYFPLFFLLLLAPREKYPGQSRWRLSLWYVAGASLCLVLCVGVPLVLSGGASNNDSGFSQDVSSIGQIAYVLQHPLRTIRMYWAWLLEFWAVDFTPTGLFANYVVHRLSPHVAYGMAGGPFAYLATAFLFLAPFGLRTKADGRYRTPALIVGAAVLTFFAFSLMAASLYVGYTPVGYETILGMQHRYVFPLLFPFLLFVPNANIENRIGPSVMAGVMLCVCALLLLGQSWWAVFSWLS